MFSMPSLLLTKVNWLPESTMGTHSEKTVIAYCEVRVCHAGISYGRIGSLINIMFDDKIRCYND